MARVTGIGGIFFKAKDPEGLSKWYAEHLGLPLDQYGTMVLRWGAGSPDAPTGSTVFAPFPEDTDYFLPSNKPFMLNFRVDDLHALLAKLKAEGVAVDDKVEDHEFGLFGRIMDPEGNRVELWQPKEGV